MEACTGQTILHKGQDNYSSEISPQARQTSQVLHLPGVVLMALYVKVRCKSCGFEQDARIPEGADNTFRAPCGKCTKDMTIRITRIEAVALKKKYNGNGGGQ